MNEDVSTWEEYGLYKMNEVGFPTYADVRKPTREIPAYLEVLRKFDTTEHPNDDLESASLVICNTAPYHNGIVTGLKDANQVTGKKAILCMVGDPFKDNEIFKQMSTEFLNANKDYLHTIIVTKHPQFSDISRIANEKKLKIDSLYCSNKNAADYMTQTGNRNLSHTNSNDNLRSDLIIDSLKNDDLTTFKKLSPSFVHNYFYKLKNDLKPA